MVVRRLLIALAVLIALTAVAAGVDTRKVAEDPPPSAVPSAVAEAPTEVTKRIDADAAKPTRIRAKTGDTMVLEVSSREVDSIEIVDLNQIQPVDPDAPAHFELYLDTPGDFPIVMLQAERRIATLTVD